LPRCSPLPYTTLFRSGRRCESHLTANASKVWETVVVSWGVFGDHPHVVLDLAVVRLKQDYSFAGLVSIIEHLQMGADGRNSCGRICYRLTSCCSNSSARESIGGIW